MKFVLLVLISMSLFFAPASAAEDRILQTGDTLDVDDGVTLTRWSVRTALRQYGYTNFGPGALQGHIIRITAWGPDKNRYELSVHWTTHEVVRVLTPRNFWY